jgi:hypothetical protein
MILVSEHASDCLEGFFRLEIIQFLLRSNRVMNKSFMRLIYLIQLNLVYWVVIQGLTSRLTTNLALRSIILGHS